MEFKHITLLLLVLLAFSACQNDQDLAAPVPGDARVDHPEFIVDDNEDGHTLVAQYPVDPAIEAFTTEASEDYLDAKREEVTRPDGTVETVYVVGDDIELSKEQLLELRGMDAAMRKQYRTTNTVWSTNTINIRGVSSGSYALTPKMRTALRWAVNNYNALNTNKTFVLTFGAYPIFGGAFYDGIIVYREYTNPAAGGRAGFPYSNGRPYKYVRIYAGMENYNYNTNEHVMTHELGHCMGLRHSDWSNRLSCGSYNPESFWPSGAWHVPGTPTANDPNSVMEACFSSNEDGEFGYYDRVALEYLY